VFRNVTIIKKAGSVGVSKSVSFKQAAVWCVFSRQYFQRYVTQCIAFDTVLKCHIYHELTDTKFCNIKHMIVNFLQNALFVRILQHLKLDLP
jgi:hypothetical protein